MLTCLHVFYLLVCSLSIRAFRCSHYFQWAGTVGGTVFWDALIAHVIVHQAEIRGIGVYTSVELFNEVLDLHFDSSRDISPLGKIQIARAIGVAIVKQGSMYPTMELLLRHAIQYLGLRGKAVVSMPGTLDSEDGFIMDLGGIDPEDPDIPGLSKEEQTVVLSVHLMALMLDGAFVLPLLPPPPPRSRPLLGR